MSRARVMRRILGIVLGAAAAIAIMLALEAIAHTLYPVDTDVESATSATLADVMSAVPLPARIIVVLGWFLAAFAGAWLALRICDWRPAGWIVAALILAGGIANLLALPHPLWMQVAAIVAPLAGGWLAQRVHHKPYRGEPLLG